MASRWSSPAAGTSGIERVVVEKTRTPLLLAAIALYFVGLGASSIWDANEAFYVDTPRQMVLSGDYINPSFNGAPRFNKPVLSYWIVAGLYRAFGTSAAVERFGIALGALGLFAATFVIGRIVRSTRVGVTAALILASSPRVLMWSRRIFIDMYLALFMALTLMFFVLAMSRPGHRRRYLLLMYVAIGLGVLTKGPIAAALPLLVCLAYLAWTRRLGELRRLMLPLGSVIVIAIVAPWYVAIYAQHGWKYIVDFLWLENVGRYTETFGLQDRGPFFYLGILLSDLFPWALLLPVAIYAAVRRTGDANSLPDESRDLRRLLIAWIVVIVGVFTFSHTKQDLYIFPIVPAVATLMALMLDDAGARPSRAVMASVASVAIAMGVVGAGLAWLFGPTAGANTIPGAMTMAVVIGIGAVITAIAVGRGALSGAVTAIAITAIAANWVLVLVALPAFERFKPVVPMTRVIEQRARPGAVVAQYQIILPSMVFYLGRPIEPFFDIPSLARRAEAVDDMYVVIRPAEYDLFRTQTRVTTCVLDRRPLFEDKIANVLRHQPWPELLLVGVGSACR
jgi:4-amino-4-deoxy-L-arabinose transferase-like glycosyltransferase